MNLTSQIEADLTEALREKNEVKKTVLRSLKSALKNASIEKNQAALSEEEELQVIAREIKRRKEAIAAYETANKPELMADEQAELEILSVYLPAQLNEDEIRREVQEVLNSGSYSLSAMGQAMGAVSQKLKGKADMSAVSQIVRDELTKLG